jgi:hypothetical protein
MSFVTNSSYATSTSNLCDNDKSNKSSTTSLSSMIKKPTAFIVNFDDTNKKNENLQEAFLKYRNYKMVI